LLNVEIQLSDQAVACQDMTKIKQFQARTNSLPGLYDLLLTIVFNGVMGYFGLADADSADVQIFTYGYDLFMGLYYQEADFYCEAGLGFDIGKIITGLLSTSTETSVYVEDVIKFGN
jgi:hypothetical protein